MGIDFPILIWENGMPNLSEVANAYGILGYKVNNFQELGVYWRKNEKFNSKCLTGCGCVIEKENCYPMVAPGRSNSQMLGLNKKV